MKISKTLQIPSHGLLALLLSTLLVSCGGGSGGGSVGGGNTTQSAKPNLMGINIASPLDYEEDRLYADVIKTSRAFVSGTNPNGTTYAPVDANGWPTSDFSFNVWAGIDKMYGTYTLTFTGQATVTANPGGIIPVTYNSTNNTSTGGFVFTQTMDVGKSLSLTFTNTKLTSSSATGTGVTSIQFMRPTSMGATTSYPSGTLFNTPLQSLITKFSTIRFMDYLATNWNPQVNWSDRPLPSTASFERCTGGTGMNVPGGLACNGGYGWEGTGGPWEHVILIANMNNKDAWINIPVGATDAYITNLAKMFAYGSDGVSPYTSPQSSPLYPPLNANLNLYIEYSNELWNSTFPQMSTNCQLASDELAAGVNSSGDPSYLNWDGAWNGNVYNSTNTASGSWNWTMCDRHTTERTVQISNIFRSVFGGAAMSSRIRPVLESQLGTPGGALGNEMQMMLNYYDNLAPGSAPVSTPHPPGYYLYGAGGSAYYFPAQTDSTLDAFFADLGSSFASDVQGDIPLVAAMGLKRVAYEGGPSLDKLGNAVDAVAPLSIVDPRMKTALINFHNIWSANGGDLLMYLSATGDYRWGFAQSIYDLSTQKLQAIDALNAAPKAAVTFGTSVPGSVSGTNADTCSQGYGCSPMGTMGSSGNQILWASYTFNSTAASSWSINLTFTTASSNASVAVYVDGVLIGTKSTTGGALSFPAGTIGSGLHGVIVQAAAGSFKVNAISVVQN